MVAWLLHPKAPELEGITCVNLLLLPYASDAARDVLTPFLLANPWIAALNLPDLASFLKALHNGIRVTETFIDGSYLGPEAARQLYGLDSLCGRNVVFETDVVSEMLQRAAFSGQGAIPELRQFGKEHPQMVYNAKLYWEWLEQAIAEALVSVAPEKIRIQPFKKWYSLRQFWGASGGAPGARFEWHILQDGDQDDKSSPFTVERVRLNKRAALLMVDGAKLRAQLNRADKAIMYSKAATKYENGKCRTIWNTSIQHYVAQAYLLDLYEPNVQQGGWYSASDGALARLIRAATRQNALNKDGVFSFMWDYSDFNINHQTRAMVLLFTKLQELLVIKAVSDTAQDKAEALADIRAITEWVNSAKTGMFLEDTRSGYIQAAVRSLASGERATSFTNTMLSRAYRLVHDRAAHHLLGRALLHGDSSHQGDDVFASTNSAFDATLAAALFLLLGWAGQAAKLNADFTARGEYLRVAYLPGNICGYPVRGFAGLFSGEFFSDLPADPASRSAALFSQISKVKNRGCHIPDSLLERLLRRNAALVYTERGTQHRVTVPPAIALLPSAYGGFGAEAAHEYQIKGFVNVDDLHVASISTVASQLPANRRVAFCIPSSGGKTSLARDYPTMFVDHDTLCHPIALSLITDVDLRNKYLRSVVPDTDYRILLTWARDCIPSSYKVEGVFTLIPRAAETLVGEQNSKLLRGYRGAILCKDQSEIRANTLARAAQLMVDDGLSPFSGQRLVAKHDLDRAPPRLRAPSLPIDEIVYNARLADTNTIMSLGKGHLMQQVVQAAGTSSFGGAFPRSLMSDSLAEYARTLHAWLKRVKITEAIESTRLPTCYPILLNRMDTTLLKLASTLHDCQTTSPLVASSLLSQLPRSYYGLADRVALSCGYSMLAIFKAAAREDGKTPAAQAFSILAMLPMATAGTSASVRKAKDWLSVATRVTANNNRLAENLINYFWGEMDFIPATGPYSSDVLSAARTLALHAAESQLYDVLALPALNIRNTVDALSQVAAVFITSQLLTVGSHTSREPFRYQV
jgi:hypothetical protein